jgi:hypothetical protein
MMKLNRDEYMALLSFIDNIRPRILLNGILLETMKRKTISVLYTDIDIINTLTELGYIQTYKGKYGVTFIHRLFVSKHMYDTNPKELKKVEITFE